MQWSDEGVVLSVRAHGETSAIAEVLTRAHGRCLGLVHGGRGRTKRPILQPGNHITAQWRARLSEQLGTMTLELKHPYAAELLDSRLGLCGIECLTTFARLLPERDPHPNLFEITLFVLGFLDDDDIWPALYARWELALLQELGFGLDLTACVEVRTDVGGAAPEEVTAMASALTDAVGERRHGFEVARARREIALRRLHAEAETFAGDAK